MAVIRHVKIDCVMQMLMKCFYGTNSISKNRLESTCDTHTIRIAIDEKYIEYVETSKEYRITNKGIKYRDKRD